MEEVMWCLSELVLMLGSSAGPPSKGFDAGTGGTGHAGGKLTGRSNTCLACSSHTGVGSPRRRRLGKAVPSRTGELAAPSGSASEELSEELPRVATAGPVGGVPGAGDEEKEKEEEWVGYTCPTLPRFPCREVILHKATAVSQEKRGAFGGLLCGVMLVLRCGGGATAR